MPSKRFKVLSRQFCVTSLRQMVLGEQRECAVDGVADEEKMVLARCYTLFQAVVEAPSTGIHTAAPILLSIDLLYRAMIN